MIEWCRGVEWEGPEQGADVLRVLDRFTSDRPSAAPAAARDHVADGGPGQLLPTSAGLTLLTFSR